MSNKMNEFIEVTIPGDSSISGNREKALVHYSQFIFGTGNQKGLCYVNFCGKWAMPLEMNDDIISQIRDII